MKDGPGWLLKDKVNEWRIEDEGGNQNASEPQERCVSDVTAHAEYNRAHVRI